MQGCQRVGLKSSKIKSSNHGLWQFVKTLTIKSSNVKSLTGNYRELKLLHFLIKNGIFVIFTFDVFTFDDFSV